MNDNVFDILIYLFEHLDSESIPMTPHAELHRELEHAGFEHSGIERALSWLEGLSRLTTERPDPLAKTTFHLYSEHELATLSTEVRGYLLQLEQMHILSPAQRELVLERLFALAVEDVTIDEVQWIVLIVLSCQPEEGEALERMEALMFEDLNDCLH